MLAVKGISINGMVRLIEKAPTGETEVLVIFPDANDVTKKTVEKAAEVRNILDKYRGRLKSVTDEKEARMEATVAKYESIN